ncbi:phage tail protein [Paenibacillus humicola]|uniref:phage tail protein n=1 Tax=Paenibacillus humicola TaxID=3110540 RepID=UPI00237AE985|nr:tail fiber protein [Paenibacillus humicola]
MSEPYLGEIRLFAGTYAPVGWEFCNGQLLSISQNDALFSLLGTTYGGDGQTTFGLPDLRGRVPLGQGKNPTGSSYAMGQLAGTETVTLTVNNLPGHTHAVMANNTSGTTGDPSNAFWAQSTSTQYATAAPDAQMSAQSIASSGGSQPHDNMMPTLAVSYIIALNGIYPSQN